MITKLGEQDLIDFEEKVVNAFNAGQIKAPVHLASGNEDCLLSAFDDQTAKC